MTTTPTAARDFVTVPREPTDAMLAAVEGFEVTFLIAEDVDEERRLSADDCAEVWRAMLAAAPAEPSAVPAPDYPSAERREIERLLSLLVEAVHVCDHAFEDSEQHADDSYTVPGEHAEPINVALESLDTLLEPDNSVARHGCHRAEVHILRLLEKLDARAAGGKQLSYANGWNDAFAAVKRHVDKLAKEPIGGLQ